jgi:TonB family protein
MREFAPLSLAALLLAGCASTITLSRPAASASSSSAAPAQPAPNKPAPAYYNSYGIDGKLGATEAAVAHIHAANKVLERQTAGHYDTPIRLTNSPEPVLPMEVLQGGIEGTVEVEIAFGASGKVAGVKVVKSPNVLLTNAVLEAVWGWTITPPTVKGKPSSFIADQSFVFQMKD